MQIKEKLERTFNLANEFSALIDMVKRKTVSLDSDRIYLLKEQVETLKRYSFLLTKYLREIQKDLKQDSYTSANGEK